jgi:hypothetical protein
MSAQAAPRLRSLRSSSRTEACCTAQLAADVLSWRPVRTDYGWRCGSCRWTASTYKTRKNAEKSADKHAGEHRGIAVRWNTRLASR